MKILKNFENQVIKNPQAIKGGANGKGTKPTASQPSTKPRLL